MSCAEQLAFTWEEQTLWQLCALLTLVPLLLLHACLLPFMYAFCRSDSFILIFGMAFFVGHMGSFSKHEPKQASHDRR